MPLLKNTANNLSKDDLPVRVISVSSEAHKRAQIGTDMDFSDVNNNSSKYGQSKLAQIMHMK